MALREEYNSRKNPLDLFVLVAYSFNHQIRFNAAHRYNIPFGKERSSYNENMKNNLLRFLEKIHSKNFVFRCGDFKTFDFESLTAVDFVYADPPYLITTGTYNDGKRGFTGWNPNEETMLLKILEGLNDRGVRFALSNVTEHKGKENSILKEWIERNRFFVHELSMSYKNSNYQTSNYDKGRTIEVLITNLHCKSMRYIGNKENILDKIYSILTENGVEGDSFFDFFSGTTSVARYYKSWVIGYLAVIFCICLFACKRRISKTIGSLCSDDYYRHCFLCDVRHFSLRLWSKW